MKAVILAGGLGTRISEESHLIPKPMIKIGGMPIIWHIMKHYEFHGITEFVICCGYKGYSLKEYFLNYSNHNSDVPIDLSSNKIQVHHTPKESWSVTLVDTGLETQTGGRIKRVQDFIDGTFCLTYGDGVSDVNISDSLTFHRGQGTKATVTAVQPAGRFGALDIRNDKALEFSEKPVGDGRWINGGFFVCEPSIFDLIDDDKTVWEQKPLKSLAAQGELSVWKHRGYWAPMDTLRDKNELENEWATGKARWSTWS